uniref:Uncharacterized protein n=1 Tax=Arundo donax TaxID=35708 RepID=A0A0A9E9L5_ARUDO
MLVTLSRQFRPLYLQDVSMLII